MERNWGFTRCTCDCGLKVPGRGEAAWWRVVEMWEQQAEAGKCYTGGVVGPAVGVSVGGELRRDRRMMSSLGFSGWAARPDPRTSPTSDSCQQLAASVQPAPFSPSLWECSCLRQSPLLLL